MPGCLFFGDRARFQQGIGERMVFRQLLELAAAQQINAAVADSGDVESVAGFDEHGDGRPHVVKVGVELAEGHDFDVGVRDRLIDRRTCTWPFSSRLKSTSCSSFLEISSMAISLAFSPAHWPPIPSATRKNLPLESARQRSSLFSR